MLHHGETRTWIQRKRQGAIALSLKRLTNVSLIFQATIDEGFSLIDWTFLVDTIAGHIFNVHGFDFVHHLGSGGEKLCASLHPDANGCEGRGGDSQCRQK